MIVAQPRNPPLRKVAFDPPTGGDVGRSSPVSLQLIGRAAAVRPPERGGSEVSP